MAQAGLPFVFSGHAMSAAAYGLSVTLKNPQGLIAWELRFVDVSLPTCFVFGQTVRVTLPLDLRKGREPLSPTYVEAVVLSPTIDVRGSVRWSYIEVSKGLS